MDSVGISPKAIWKEYMDKLINEENIFDQNVDAGAKEGPASLIVN